LHDGLCDDETDDRETRRVGSDPWSVRPRSGGVGVSGFLRAVSRISGFTLLSRILGFTRDIAMFRLLGFDWWTGTFILAWMIPNLLRRLFGEGALSASFIPAYAAAHHEGGPDAARRLLASVSGLLLLILTAITLTVLATCLVLPPEAIGRGDAAVDATEQGRLMLRLTVLLFPYAIPICLAAIFAGCLNFHGVFGLPAASPVVLNVFWLAALGLAWAGDMSDPTAIVTLIAVFLLAGGIAQMLLSLVPLWRRGLAARPCLPAPGGPATTVLQNMWPTVIGMSLVQVSTLLDQALAYYLVSAEAPSYLYAANRLLLFPHALTSLSLATAIFPRLASLGATRDLVGLRQGVDRAMLQTMWIALPAAVGMMLVARPLVQVMFGEQVEAPDKLANTTWTTICLVASLPSIGVAQLHARALYALGDFRTPARMAFYLLLLNVALNLLFVVWLDMGVPGFAVATTLASIVNACGLRARLRQMCPEAGAPTGSRMTSTFLACGVMAVAVWWSQSWFEPTSQVERVAFHLLLPIAVGVVSYPASLYAMGWRRATLAG
jgi:putative peptidoglycan lipid II flippase